MEPYCGSNPNNALKGPAWAQGEIKLGFGPSLYALYHILYDVLFIFPTIAPFQSTATTHSIMQAHMFKPPCGTLNNHEPSVG